MELQLDRAKSAGAQDVRISGGEPTLSPHLPRIIAAARDRNLRPILTTNGRALTKGERLDALSSLGLKGIRVSIHGASAETHDGVVGVAGAFRQSVHALALSSRSNLRREMVCVITRENARELVPIVDLAAKLRVTVLELRDADGELGRPHRVADAHIDALLSRARDRCAQKKVYLRVHGFERARPARRAETFADDARWPGARSRAQPFALPERVHLVGEPGDRLLRGSTLPRIAAALRQRGAEVAQYASPEDLPEPRGSEALVVLDYAALAALEARPPRPTWVLDFHMLLGAPSEPDPARQWPDHVRVASCFPSFAWLYASKGIAADAILPFPYPLSPEDAPRGADVRGAETLFSGGGHLRDEPTLLDALASRDPGFPAEIHSSRARPSDPAGVRWWGRSSLPEFYTALAASRLCVIPLIRDPQHASGITVAAMALATGRPVLATGTHAMRDHLDEAGPQANARLVDPGDARGLAEAMAELLADEDRLHRLSEGARLAAAQATPERLAHLLFAP